MKQRFVIRRLDSPRLFIGLWPVGLCVWKDWVITVQWNGWKHRYTSSQEGEKA